jgi:SAM-dependent methyltransferase
MSAPRLTDPRALALHRARASRLATEGALFLHEAARAEAEDRLAMVNKAFSTPAVVTPFPQVWQGVLPNLKIVEDAETLALEPSAHDLVIHAMALHWADDPVGQLIQCRHALKPDGMAFVVSLGGQTLHELRSALGQAEAEVTGGMSPRVAPMAEIRDLGALMQRAGLALPVADSYAQNVEYQSALHLMRDLRAMGETNALDSRLRRPTRRSVLLRATELYAEHFTAPSGRVSATFELITLTGWAPDASQPQPLRPGSAAQRLADALGTTETSLKD